MYNPYSCWKKGIYYTNPNILGKNIEKTLIEDQEEGLYPTLCMRDIVVFPTNMTPGNRK